MEGITDHSLFRPTPLSQLQSNLAGFYSKTSQLVKEKFEDMVSLRSSGMEPSNERHSPLRGRHAEESESELIRAPGMGRLIDIYA